MIDGPTAELLHTLRQPAVGPARDFVGYGRNPPSVVWPNGARIAVSLCLNYEEGSERSHGGGDKTSEPNYELAKNFPDSTRDLASESIFEYGSRAGVQRVLRLLDRYDIPCTVFASAVALALNPEITEWLIDSDHEICSHGWRWTEQWTLSKGDERDHIARALDLFERVAGQRPVGWYSRYGPSVNTRELLVEAGLEYDSDAYNDDLPYYTPVNGKQHLVIPYSFVYNDGKYRSHFGCPDDFLSYLTRAFDYLWEEGETTPRLMSIGLHPRIVGQAARTSALRDFLELALERGQVWFARRKDMAEWWRAHHPPEAIAGKTDRQAHQA